MKFKQIACLYLVLHVSHIMVMSRGLDKNEMDSDRRELPSEAEHFKRELSSYRRNMMINGIIEYFQNAKPEDIRSTWTRQDFLRNLSDKAIKDLAMEWFKWKVRQIYAK